METILIVAVSALNIACFLVGSTVGMKLSTGREEPVEVPKKKPVKPIRESKEETVLKEEQDRMEVILHNVEVYNGTGHGQKDVPGGE